jgi:hypothetical protein
LGGFFWVGFFGWVLLDGIFLGGFLLATLPVAGAGVPPRGCQGSPGACSVAAAWPPSPCTPAPPKQTTSVVVRIQDIMVRIRIRGSIPLTNEFGSRCGSGSCLIVSDLQDVNKKIIFFSLSFFAFYFLYFLKVHLQNCSKIKSHKEVTKQ